MEGQVQIPDEILYYISCFHETDHSKDMGGEGGRGGGGGGGGGRRHKVVCR